MRKVFIDGGGFLGQAILWAKKNTDCDEFHTFEPNSTYWENLEKLAILHKEAIWIYDGELDFYLAEKPGGSTVLLNKKTAHVDYTKSTKVPCIDFGKWIRNNFNKEDYIILKLNIEGAEYEVLRSMVKDGSIDYINELYAELHFKKFPSGRIIHDEVMALVEPHIKIKRWSVIQLNDSR